MKRELKYKLTDETLDHHGRTLYRIQALKDFGDVKAGDKGGWVESESSLSHYGNCWIYDDSIAYGSSRISEDAKVMNSSEICNFACIRGNAVIDQGSTISGEAFILDAKVSNLIISNYTQISGDIEIKSVRDFYDFGLWYPYNDEYITYLPNQDKFIYYGRSYTKEELSEHEDFESESSIILEILNKQVDLCKYYMEVYPEIK